jgi:hypothetical protein
LSRNTVRITGNPTYNELDLPLAGSVEFASMLDDQRSTLNIWRRRMRPMARRIAFLVVLAAFALGGAAQAGPKPKAIVWQTDFKKALAAAKKQKKPIFVDFYSQG